MKQLFPSVRYHRSGAKKIVHTEDQHDELVASDPENWADTPAAFDEPAPVKPAAGPLPPVAADDPADAAQPAVDAETATVADEPATPAKAAKPARGKKAEPAK